MTEDQDEMTETGENETSRSQAPDETEAQPPAEAQPAKSPREQSLEEEIGRLKDQLLRAVAETDNVRKRLEQQAEDRGKFAVANFAKDMLAVADNLRRALDSIPAEAKENDPTTHTLTEGVELTERSLIASLERHGIKRVEAVGQRFDPHHHQAMMEIEDPARTAGTVVLEMQAGYTLHGRLLRPAMVGVAKGGPKPAPEVDTVA